MSALLNVYIGQLNPIIGGIKSNAALAADFYREAATKGADYALLSELFLTGYGAKDLFLKPAFMRDVERAIVELCAVANGNTILGIGAPMHKNGELFNAYYYLQNGQVIKTILKTMLPNERCFDERRWFEEGAVDGTFEGVGTLICEDLWHASTGDAMLPHHPEILFVPNASPYARGKQERRYEVARARAKQLGAPVVYTHFVGVEDELVFDGASFVVHPDGEIVAQLPQFETAREMMVFEKTPQGYRLKSGVKTPLVGDYEADYHAMVLSLRDYAKSTGFSSAILGMSGGIDSALVACIAADALGPENVRVLMMPSRYTSQSSLDDADDCARRLGIKIDRVSISPAVDAVNHELEPIFGADPEGLVAENIQPRLRALYLMALSNKFGALLLSTGNKSEVACGYATLYGDMAGGYNPLKDLYKMRVFETCHWRTQHHRTWMKGRAGAVITEAIIAKPPSAELRPDQKDSDSLPPYEVLDVILEALVDNDKSIDDITAMGFDREMVLKIQKLVFIAEYKRFQSAPGPRLTRALFGNDRRYPIINAWRDE